MRRGGGGDVGEETRFRKEVGGRSVKDWWGLWWRWWGRKDLEEERGGKNVGD